MKEDSKRWLISRLKTSGSKRRYLVNGSYSDKRNTKKLQDFENLPQKESIKRTKEIYNGKLNYGLLVRFLRGQVGNDWDKVYSEIIKRIPTKLMDYKEIVFWFVANKVELLNGRLSNKKSGKFIWTPEQGEYNFNYDNKEFYIEPSTNKLRKVLDAPSKRKTKELEGTDLRKFREKEKIEKIMEKQARKIELEESLIISK